MHLQKLDCDSLGHAKCYPPVRQKRRFCEIGCQRLCADRRPMEKYASALQANTCKTDILRMIVGIRRMLFYGKGFKWGLADCVGICVVGKVLRDVLHRFCRAILYNLVSRCFAIGKARYHALQLRKDIYAFSLAKQSSRLQCLPEANSQAPVREHPFG